LHLLIFVEVGLEILVDEPASAANHCRCRDYSQWNAPFLNFHNFFRLKRSRKEKGVKL
jgi:hypothetical protein